MRPLLTASLALAALASLSTGPVEAQSNPIGTYQATCSNIRYVGTELTAYCKSKNGQTYVSGLRSPQLCSQGVANDDGQLRCAGKYPHGSYSKTCTSLRMTPDVFAAKCQKADGSWAGETSIPDPWACNTFITNENGRLTCSGTRVRY